jgi:predicted transcriptional regulator of viral defense system
MVYKRDTQKKILELLKSKPEGLHTTQIAVELKMPNYMTVKGACWYLHKKGLIERLTRGIYKIKNGDLK